MGFAVRAFDEVPGRGRSRIPDIRLATERVSAGDLIRRRVEMEVAAQSQPQRRVIAGFRHEDEVRLHPERKNPELKAKKLDPDEQTAKALAQFSAGKILLLIDDRQIEGVDTPVVLTKDSEITFLQLVPLVGG